MNRQTTEPEITTVAVVQALSHEELSSRPGRLAALEVKSAILEERLADAERVIQEQAQEIAIERSKREALEEATAPLLERSQEPGTGGKGDGGATRP